MSKKVFIIGTGALGKCLAALLADTTMVTVYDRDRNVRQQILTDGFIFKEGSRSKKVRVNVASSVGALKSERMDVLIFATKVMDLDSAVRMAACLKPRFVCLVQNGLFDVELLKRSFPRAVVGRCVTTMACREGLGGKAELFHRGIMYTGGEGAVQVASVFRTAGLNVKVYRDPQRFVYAKLIFNAVMNPLPIITGRGYDILDQDRGIYILVQRAIKEGRAVARSMGIRLAFDPMALIQRVKDGDLADLSHRGSMYQDFSAGRATEIDHITGQLIRTAHKLGIATPALESILVKAKAAGA